MVTSQCFTRRHRDRVLECQDWRELRAADRGTQKSKLSPEGVSHSLTMTRQEREGLMVEEGHQDQWWGRTEAAESS